MVEMAKNKFHTRKKLTNTSPYRYYYCLEFSENNNN